MISVDDPIAIGEEIPRIDSRCFLEKEYIEFICMNSFNGNIPNCQLGLFISWLCTWYFDLR